METVDALQQEIEVGNGRVILTEVEVVFSGERILFLDEPVDELRDALNEIECLVRTSRNVTRPVNAFASAYAITSYKCVCDSVAFALRSIAND